MNAGETRHIPVLLAEVLTALRASAGGIFLDCTLGGGGHTAAILEANPENRVVATDRDPEALDRSKRRLAAYGDRFIAHHAAFSELTAVVGGQRFSGVLADLGVSTDQLFGARGFSFNDGDSLDMRMDTTRGESAQDLLNTLDERALNRVLREGGVGNEARGIVRAIGRERPITTARQLAQVVSDAIPARLKKSIHPATVTFQALRIAVNRERAEIEALLAQLPQLVQVGGRAAVITFHSLEDKLVTEQFRFWEHGKEFSASWAGGEVPSDDTLGALVERRAVRPSEAEVSANPSARSARLRTFQFR